MLLHPFRIESLSLAHVAPLAKLANARRRAGRTGLVTTVATSAPAWSVADERELIEEVVSWFGLGPVIEVRYLAEGLMNRNWQVRTPAGVVAVKQVQDIGADAARRQHEATRALAGCGLPLLAPTAMVMSASGRCPD
jgi:hypothetical protein